MDLVTDQGITVDLRRFENSRDYDMGATTLDILEAWVDGEPAGYLQMYYIDQSTFDQRYATAWDYALSGEIGRYKGLKALEQTPASERSQQHWMQMFEASRMRSTQLDELRDLPVEDLAARWVQRQAEISSEVESSHLQFRSDFLNKPVVFSIKVYEERDRDRMIDGVKKEHDGPSFRRQGIGTVLYEAGAAWMHEKGMNLWAGHSQSREAEATWNKLGRRYDIQSRTAPHYGGTRERRFLDGGQVQLMGPDGPIISTVGENAAPARQEADGPAIKGTIAQHLGWDI